MTDQGIVFYGAIVAIVFIVAFIWGRIEGRSDNTDTNLPRPPVQPTNCAEACTAWDNARQNLCSASAAVEDARSRVQNIISLITSLLTVAAALAAAAVAAAVGAFSSAIVPILAILLAAIATSFGLVSFAFQVMAVHQAGRLLEAEADLTTKTAARQGWDSLVTIQRGYVNELCSTTEANECLSRAAPC